MGDSVRVWYYRARKDIRPRGSVFSPVWIEKSGREEWRAQPKRKDSTRCEGIIHRRRIVGKPFLEKGGTIPDQVYQEASSALGQPVV